MGNANIDKNSNREATQQEVLAAIVAGSAGSGTAGVETGLNTLHTDNGVIEAKLDTLHADNGATSGESPPNSGTGVIGWLRGIYDKLAGTLAISATSLPLPSGASTSVKQAAPGAAGTASTDVLSVQGISSMTALKTDGSGVTQPVSATALPLPSGAATVAKQPALGTAGSASTDVLTVQGIASGTAQPISSGATAATVGTSVGTGAKTIIDWSPILGSFMSFAFSGTYSGAQITIETSNDNGTNFFSVPFVDPTTHSTWASGGAVIGAPQLINAFMPGAYYRVRTTALTSGAVTCTAVGMPNNATPGTDSWVRIDGFNSNVGVTQSTSPWVVGGNVASGSADSGNPAKVGAKYNLTPPTFVDGNRADLQADANGYLRNTEQYAPVYEDNTVGVAVVEERYTYTHLNSNATTTIKSGAGLLSSVVINTLGASANILTLFDNTAGSGTVVAVIDTTKGEQKIYRDKFTTGLTAVMSAGTAADVTVNWR